MLDNRSQMAEKPTIVFVPGAWHPHAAFDPLLPSLHREGYATTAVSLPSVGCSPSLPSCDADNVATRNVVEGLVDLGKEVVVVSHSYGGIAINDALDGLGKKEREAQNLPGGVIRLIYVAAIVPSKGQTGQEAMGIVKSREEGGPILETRDSEVSLKLYLLGLRSFS
jgi:pimeloyl-ACP methyl ester carboxylesterase